SQQEVDTLAQFLKSETVNHQLWKGKNAYEERFHREDSLQNYDVLHIATHGYFFAAPKAAKEKKNWLRLDQPGLQFRKIDRPLMRSGLMLSGAEKAWLTGESYTNRMDGVWTAQEISELNLKNTKLAVLSACETGLGKIEGNEGVYGLQRAFKLAGVEKLLVSIWKVDDEATSLYMQQFYKNWLTGGTAYEAYRKTQTYFIQHQKYQHPYYWAGFVFME
ncbi:MAG: CHAT domain-containing protein, partial [Bacteroidota bacterium]